METNCHRKKINHKKTKNKQTKKGKGFSVLENAVSRCTTVFVISSCVCVMAQVPSLERNIILSNCSVWLKDIFFINTANQSFIFV